MNKFKLTVRDRMDIEKQMGRYNRECGDVVTYRVDPAVFKQNPVAVVHAIHHAEQETIALMWEEEKEFYEWEAHH